MKVKRIVLSLFLLIAPEAFAAPASDHEQLLTVRQNLHEQMDAMSDEQWNAMQTAKGKDPAKIIPLSSAREQIDQKTAEMDAMTDKDWADKKAQIGQSMQSMVEAVRAHNGKMTPEDMKAISDKYNSDLAAPAQPQQ